MMSLPTGCEAPQPFEMNGTTYYATHGEDIPQDTNILHRYKLYPASK